MKAQFKTTAIAILASCFLFRAQAQINLLSNDIQFRSSSNAARTTYHYGDLTLSSGSATGYGRLYSTGISCGGMALIFGNTYIYGNLLVTGTKNFVHPHPTDTTKLIKYIAVESGEALTLARGTSKTVNGLATIVLPEHFSLVTSADAPITVIVTPRKVPALLYIKEESKERIVVAMKESDLFEFRDVEFSFQVTGVRDGFEDEEVIVDIAEKDGRKNISKKRAAYNERVKTIAEKSKKEEMAGKK